MSQQTRSSVVFLGAPFSAAQARDGSGRLYFRDEKLRARILGFIEAMQTAGFFVLNAHLTEKWGEEPPPDGMVHRDFGWIEQCGVYVAFLPNDEHGLPYRTDGTFMELGYAIALKKKVIVLIDDPAAPAWSTFVNKLILTPLVEVVAPDEFLREPSQIVQRHLQSGHLATRGVMAQGG